MKIADIWDVDLDEPFIQEALEYLQLKQRKLDQSDTIIDWDIYVAIISQVLTVRARFSSGEIQTKMFHRSELKERE